MRSSPAIPAVVEHDDDRLISLGDEREVLDYNATWDDETVGAFRAGYLCLRCWERQDCAFPDSCGLCGYAMKERQSEDFSQEFKGLKWVGPRTTIDDEVERMREGKRIWTPGSSISTVNLGDNPIWTPRGA